MKSAVCLLLVFVVVEYVSTTALPSYIPICHQSDPNLNECVMNAVEKLRPKLLKGIPELDVPPLEMIKIEDMNINYGTEQAGLRLNLTNVKIQGTSNFILKNLKLNVPNMIYKMAVLFPKIRIMGDYAAEATLLSFPIKTDGYFDTNATNCDAIAILKGTLVKDQFKHLHFTDLIINLKIADYNMKLDNVIDGDDSLNKAINELANSSKQELIKIALPLIESRASMVILEIANQIVQNLEYDKVFPK